jgi:hypothetical protein
MSPAIVNYPSDTNRITKLVMPANGLNGSQAALNASIQALTDAAAAQALLNAVATDEELSGGSGVITATNLPIPPTSAGTHHLTCTVTVGTSLTTIGGAGITVVPGPNANSALAFDEIDAYLRGVAIMSGSGPFTMSVAVKVNTSIEGSGIFFAGQVGLNNCFRLGAEGDTGVGRRCRVSDYGGPFEVGSQPPGSRGLSLAADNTD